MRANARRLAEELRITGAVKFYKRLGYALIRTIPRYYLDSLDAFQMAKRFE